HREHSRHAIPAVADLRGGGFRPSARSVPAVKLQESCAIASDEVHLSIAIEVNSPKDKVQRVPAVADLNWSCISAGAVARQAVQETCCVNHPEVCGTITVEIADREHA